ncbi:MAG: low-specificity L-threonine aldolase [Candidatus Marinimicrobia bacterium]|nr:low-specificity L-threonine aldolase [Candidatus Neomarinimicrobiota bacterium]
MNIIDLRSDTVTLPTKEMMDAIQNAKLGDDVLEDDFVVKKLEDETAKLSGKDAALFVPSGTMGNLISIMVHCPRGSEVILGDKSHTFKYEAGGISALGGIHSAQLSNNSDGTIDIDKIKTSIREDNVHFPKTACISLENSHNLCNGSPINIEYLSQVYNIAQENNLKVHTDGARIFNSAVALNLELKELTTYTDSITFCLSKGLSAPIGSMVCGTKEFIYHARRTRKILGGGMRQVGILASAGLISISKMTNQLKTDHLHLSQLANGLSQIKKIEINPTNYKTNILYFSIKNNPFSDEEFIQHMEKQGIRFFALSKNKFRLVTHSGISDKDIHFTLNVFNNILN